MDSPRVSIAMPVYNGAATIGAAIESALAQTFEDFELIVVDNDSTDGTREVVESFDDPRIRLVRQPRNLGFLPNHNRSMWEGSGEFMKPLHADDRLLPTCLEAMLDLFDRQPSVGLVFAPREVEIDDSDAMLRWWRDQFGAPHEKFTGLQEVNRGPDLLRQYLAEGLAISDNWVGEPVAVMLRRTVLQRIGLYSANIMTMNDMDMNMRAMALYDIGFVAEPQSVYVRHRGSLVDSLGKIDWLDRVWMLQGLVEDEEIVERLPEVAGVLARERMRIGRMLLGAAARRPRTLPARLKQLGTYLRHCAARRAGRAAPLHEALPR